MMILATHERVAMLRSLSWSIFILCRVTEMRLLCGERATVIIARKEPDDASINM